MKKVINYLKDLKINEYIVCATSGGIDSMVLLSLLNKVYKNRVVCAHVNHNKRTESEEERHFLEEYCYKNNIVFEYLKLEKISNNNFHEEARKKRLEFFKNICDKHNSNYLFTAHHNDDLIETILMRLSRGSSLAGYGGFQKNILIGNLNIIKPLIEISKDQIELYSKNNKIPFRLDKSNNSMIYTRNRYRHNIIPILKKEEKNLGEKYLKFSTKINEYSLFFEKYVSKKYNEIVDKNQIDLKKLLNEEEIIRKEIIRKYLELIYKDDINLFSDIHIKNIMSLINNSKPNFLINLPKNMVFIKKYDIIYIVPFISNKKYEDKVIQFNDNLCINHGTLLFDCEDNEKSNYVIRLNSNEIKLPLYVRSKKNGDKIKVKGISKYKKIKDIYINDKVDIDKRNIYLLVDSNDEILFIPGIKKSVYDKEFNDDYDITIKFIEKKEKL